MDDSKRQRIGGHHQNNRGWKLCSHNRNGSYEEKEEKGHEEDGEKETEVGEEDPDHAYCRQKAGNHGDGHDRGRDQKGKEEDDHGEKEYGYYGHGHGHGDRETNRCESHGHVEKEEGEGHGQCDRETNLCESHGHVEKEEGEGEGEGHGHGHGHGQKNEEDHGHSGDEEKQCPGEHDERLLQPLLPGLDDETSLRCISLLPIRDLRKLALLSVRHRTLLKSGAMMFEIRRRKQCVFEEHFIFLSLGSDPSEWAVYDVREDTCESLSPVHAYASSAHLEPICIVNHVIWYDPIGNFDYRYDHLMKEWEEAPPMVNRRSLFASASGPGNFAYVAGGLGRPHRRCHSFLREEASVNALQTAEVYDARMNRWNLLPPMPAPRFKCSGVIMNDKFYVIGGKDANNTPLSSAEEYDILTRTWRTIEDMYLIKSRSDMSDCSMPPLVAVLWNRLYAVEVNTSTLRVYENHLNAWKDVSQLPILADIGNGCGVMFKALGDHGLLIMGDLGDLLFGCIWSPGDSSEWRVLCHINVQPTFHGRRFLCNCPVMSC